MSRLIERVSGQFQEHKRSKYLIGKTEFTYGQLFDDVCSFARFLRVDVPTGERIVLSVSDDRSLLTAFYASVVSGVTAVILDPRAPVTELATLVKAADARAIVADTVVLDGLRDAGALDGIGLRVPASQSATSTRPRFRLFGAKKETPDSAPTNDFASVIAANAGSEAFSPAEVDDEAIAYILFTSGTTSQPKGVMISHRALHAQMETFVSNYGLDKNSRVMNLLPFHHTDGLTQGAVMCLYAGATFVRPYAFTPDILPQMMQDMYKHAVSHLVTVPSVMALTKSLESEFDSSFDYPEFNFVISTAAYLDPDLWQACEGRFGIKIVNVYGLTETVCETMYCGPSDNLRRIGSVGKPVDSLAKVVDEEGNELADEQSGELLVGGDHIMSGYFNNPEATAEVLEDGWFRTGDLAKRDKDGFYFIVGRKKDLIISGGMNIYPEDVNCVLRSLPGVLDAVTFGIADPLWGERAVSCVLCDKDAEPSVENIVENFLQRASKQKLPREIVKLESFPRGPAGKVVMSEVKALFALQSHRDTEEVDADNSVSAQVFSIASRVLRCEAEQLTEAAEAETVPGWTSLSHVELMLAIEETFGFQLSSREIMKFRRLGDVIDIVNKRMAA